MGIYFLNLKVSFGRFKIYRLQMASFWQLAYYFEFVAFQSTVFWHITYLFQIWTSVNQFWGCRSRLLTFGIDIVPLGVDFLTLEVSFGPLGVDLEPLDRDSDHS